MIRGFTQTEVARTVAAPDHWSRLRLRSELSTSGRFNENVRWKLSGRLDYDGVFDVTNSIPRTCGKMNESTFSRARITSTSRPATGTFASAASTSSGVRSSAFFSPMSCQRRTIAIFSSRNSTFSAFLNGPLMRRIPASSLHVELVWIPVPTYDKLPKPGAEFFALPVPSPPGVVTQVAGETHPGGTLTSNYGVRVSTLQAGWDVAAFYYRSMDASPTFYRQILSTPQPTVLYSRGMIR